MMVPWSSKCIDVASLGLTPRWIPLQNQGTTIQSKHIYFGWRIKYKYPEFIKSVRFYFVFSPDDFVIQRVTVGSVSAPCLVVINFTTHEFYPLSKAGDVHVVPVM